MRKFLQTSLKYYLFLSNYDSKWIEKFSDHIHISMCVSATRHKWHKLTTAINQREYCECLKNYDLE